MPITADLSRVFYFNTNYGRSIAERLLNGAWFIFVRKWLKNYNFSGQDQGIMEPQVYNQPEALSATDVFPLALRRLIVERARDFRDTKTVD